MSSTVQNNDNTANNEDTVQCPNCSHRFSVPTPSPGAFTCGNHGCFETFTRRTDKKRHMRYHCPIRQEASEDDVQRCPYRKCTAQQSFRPDKLISHLAQAHRFREDPDKSDETQSLPGGPGQHVFPINTTAVPQIGDSEVTDTSEGAWTSRPGVFRELAAPSTYGPMFQRQISPPLHDSYHHDHTQRLPFSSSDFPLTVPFDNQFDPTTPIGPGNADDEIQYTNRRESYNLPHQSVANSGSNIAAGSAFHPNAVREQWNDPGSVALSFSSSNQGTHGAHSTPMARSRGHRGGYQRPLHNEPRNRGGDSHEPQSFRSSSNNSKRQGRGK